MHVRSSSGPLTLARKTREDRAQALRRSSDHDVRRRRLGIQELLPAARGVPTAVLLDLEEFPHRPQQGQGDAQDEPEPAERDVRGVVEEAEEEGEGCEYACCTDDDDPSEEGGETDLALAGHRAQK